MSYFLSFALVNTHTPTRAHNPYKDLSNGLAQVNRDGPSLALIPCENHVKMFSTNPVVMVVQGR